MSNNNEYKLIDPHASVQLYNSAAAANGNNLMIGKNQRNQPL